jgi:DNA end-binding protein Ku
MAARSIWKGSISFGLVNIPIKLYSATEDRVYSFNQLDAKGHRINYKRWCSVEDREVPYDEIRKGYEISKDNYVVIEKSELQNIKIKTTKTVDIKQFMNSKELDPIFVEKSYNVGPDSKTPDKAYLLLVNILKSTNKIAIGKVVLRDREQVVALRAYQRGIVMHVLHYLDEIRPIDEIPDISRTKTKLDEKELQLGRTLVDQLTSEEFDASQYTDAYSKEVENLIEAKAKGKELVSAPEVGGQQPTKDLLEALKASVKKTGGGKGKRQ